MNTGKAVKPNVFQKYNTTICIVAVSFIKRSHASSVNYQKNCLDIDEDGITRDVRPGPGGLVCLCLTWVTSFFVQLSTGEANKHVNVPK